jgi:hypothetical protein
VGDGVDCWVAASFTPPAVPPVLVEDDAPDLVDVDVPAPDVEVPPPDLPADADAEADFDGPLLVAPAGGLLF